MSYCEKEGKDVRIFLKEEEISQPSSIQFEKKPEKGVGMMKEDGNINWGCPCLGNNPTGPCGVEFREAFTCIIKHADDDAETKADKCGHLFSSMLECQAIYPEIYDTKAPPVKDDKDPLDTKESEGKD